MTTTNQWIPLTGPGGRLPTEADASTWGGVYVANNKTSAVRSWELTESQWTHWAPIPKAPPLPKPVEKTQAEKQDEADKAKSLEIIKGWWGNPLIGTADLVLMGIAYGRSDGRAQLAREALGLLDFKHAQAIAIDQGYQALPIALRHLEELLTKAAGETP